MDQQEATTDLPKRGKVTIKFGELIVSSDFDSGSYCKIGGVAVPNILTLRLTNLD